MSSSTTTFRNGVAADPPLAKLAAAVSEAGGLGIITGLSQGSPEGLRAAIRECKKLTSKPFAVNLVRNPLPEFALGLLKARSCLQTFLPSISPPPYEQYAEVIIQEGVKVVETAGGPAATPIIKMLRAKDVYVIHKCTTIRHARTAARVGANMLSIDGFECAGHPGEDDIGGVVLVRPPGGLARDGIALTGPV